MPTFCISFIREFSFTAAVRATVQAVVIDSTAEPVSPAGYALNTLIVYDESNDYLAAPQIPDELQNKTWVWVAV